MRWNIHKYRLVLIERRCSSAYTREIVVCLVFSSCHWDFILAFTTLITSHIHILTLWRNMIEYRSIYHEIVSVRTRGSATVSLWVNKTRNIEVGFVIHRTRTVIQAEPGLFILSEQMLHNFHVATFDSIREKTTLLRVCKIRIATILQYLEESIYICTGSGTGHGNANVARRSLASCSSVKALTTVPQLRTAASPTACPFMSLGIVALVPRNITRVETK